MDGRLGVQDKGSSTARAGNSVREPRRPGKPVYSMSSKYAHGINGLGDYMYRV
ncbi:MAG: hypothetical protein ACLUGJ_02845 [Blautia wexlerae]